MIPGVEHPEVCYKTQRLATLPQQLQGGGKGTMICACPWLFSPSLRGPSYWWGWQGGLYRPGIYQRWEILLFPTRASRQHWGKEQGLPWGGSMLDAQSVCWSGMGIWPLCPASCEPWIPSHIFQGAGDPAAPGGPAGLSYPPGGLVRGGSGCWRWRR